MPLPAALTARRADSTTVIGSALLASARRSGYRQTATQLDRPPSTVQRWIRAVRDPAHVEWLRGQGVHWLATSTVTSWATSSVLTSSLATARRPARSPRR